MKVESINVSFLQYSLQFAALYNIKVKICAFFIQGGI